MEVGNRIRQVRKEKKMKMSELADKLNVSVQAVSQYELNKRDIGIDLLHKIADALEISVYDLIDAQTEKDMMMQEISLIQDKYKEQEALTSGHYEINDAMNFWFNEDLLIRDGKLNPSKAILGYIYDTYKQIFSHYHLEEKFKMSAVDFFYSDRDNALGLFSSIINAIIGQSYITKMKIDNNKNAPITEKIKLPFSMTENKDLKDFEKKWKVHFYDLGEKENCLKYNTKTVIDHLENIKNIDSNFTADDIEKIIKTVKSIE